MLDIIPAIHQIRKQYPEALYIELEPDGGEATGSARGQGGQGRPPRTYAIDDLRGHELLQRREIEAIDNFQQLEQLERRRFDQENEL